MEEEDARCDGTPVHVRPAVCALEDGSHGEGCDETAHLLARATMSEPVVASVSHAGKGGGVTLRTGKATWKAATKAGADSTPRSDSYESCTVCR